MTGEQYLEQHGLTVEFAKSKGIAWNNNTLDIPIEDGKTKWIKHRNLNFDPDDDDSVKYTNDLGSKAALFNLAKFKDAKTLILTEGEMDALKLEFEGIPAISTTSGAEKFDKRFAAKLKNKNLYICYDNDNAGRLGIMKVLSFLPDTKIVCLPDEAKDICEFFVSGKTKKDFLSIKPISYDDWLTKNEPAEFSFLEGSKLLIRDIPKEEWLIDRILPVEGFTFLVGAEATGKSFLTLTIADAITTGNKWLDQFEVKKTTNVLFIDKENTKRRTQTRLKGLGIAGENIYWVEYPQFLDVNDDKEDDGFSIFIKSVARKVRNYHIGLIIIDSFTDVMVGNENAAGDTQRFFDGFRQLFPGVSVLVLHHENKPTQGTPRTSSQRTRGSTNITAQIVVGFRMEATHKKKGEFTMEQTKVGDAEKLSKFKIKMEVFPDPDNVFKTVVTALSYGGEVSDEVNAVDESSAFIQDHLATNINQRSKDVIEAGVSAGHSRTSLERAISMLKDKKILKIKVNPDKKREKFLSISDPDDDPEYDVGMFDPEKDSL